VTTWETLRAEIAEATATPADEVPQPGTEAFNHMLGLLLDSHPDLASRVQAWLVQATDPVASQTEITTEARKAAARDRIASLFTKRDPTQPHRRRMNRSVILTVVIAGIALLWLVGRLHSPASVPMATRPPARVPGATSAQPMPTPPPAPELQPASRGPVARGAVSPAAGGPATPLPTPPLPFLPSGPAQAPPATQLGSRGPADGGASSAAATEAVQVVVGATPQTVSATVVSSVASGGGSGTSGTAQGGTVQGGTVVVTAAAQGSGGTPSSGSAQAPPAAAAPASPRFEIGDQFTVKLMTPLAVSPVWQALPVVALAQDGPIAGWQVIGSAAQGQDGSLQITWTQALSPDRATTIKLQGVGYDPKIGKPGVPGAASSAMAPQAARTALSGTLGAVSQYVQDQINAQQTAVAGITATITSQVPPFWQILSQQLATGFQPGPVQTGGTVMVTRVPAGTPVLVFITAAS